MAKTRSLYDVLGIDKNADHESIKKAYRNKTRECHPDRHADKAEQFKQVQEAWEVLGDKDKRDYYDATGQIPGAVINDPELAETVELISTALRHVISRAFEMNRPLKSFDMVNALDAHFQDTIKSAKTMINQIQKLIDAMEDSIKRYKRKKEGENLLASVTRALIAEKQKDIEGVKASITKFENIKKLLKDYGYEIEKIDPYATYEERARQYKAIFDKPPILEDRR